MCSLWVDWTTATPCVMASMKACLLNKLQEIQNAAARFVTDTRKYDHITPVFEICIGFQFVKESSSNWRPWSTNVSTVCVHPTLQRTAYGCLYTTRGRQHLRSAGRLELLVPRTRIVTFGPRAFAVAGPGVWNSLPPALREPTLSFNCFRRGLKTFLFR